MTCLPLRGTRILAAINGLELFGHQRGNIEVLKTLRESGADIRVGVEVAEEGGAVGAELRRFGFDTLLLPFGCQWSRQWLAQDPRDLWRKTAAVARCSRRFHAAMRGMRPTHLYIGSPLTFSYLCLALAASRVPLVYRMGDCPPVDSPFNLRIWRLAAMRSARIVANSGFVRRSAIAAGAPPQRVSVIYGVAPSTGPVAADTAHAGASATGRCKRLVYVGQFSEHKGIRVLVQALSILAKRFPDLGLDVVGESRYEGAFRREIEELVHTLGLAGAVSLVGQVADPSRFYREAAVHVAPSIWEEPLANVVLEAKREGIPSVVFRAGGLPEVVRHGVDGVICEERTPESLASGLAWLLEDDERCRAAGRAAREDYVRRFGPERFAREWTAVFLDDAPPVLGDSLVDGGAAP